MAWTLYVTAHKKVVFNVLGGEGTVLAPQSGPASSRAGAEHPSGAPGWQQAIRVSAAIDAYYPIGAAACCTPALLLASGDAWCAQRQRSYVLCEADSRMLPRVQH